MAPRNKRNKEKQGEPTYIVVMESWVDLVEEELTNMKTIMEIRRFIIKIQ